LISLLHLTPKLQEDLHYLVVLLISARELPSKGEKSVPSCIILKKQTFGHTSYFHPLTVKDSLKWVPSKWLNPHFFILSVLISTINGVNGIILLVVLAGDAKMRSLGTRDLS
jgi:hypothetical protein